MREFSLSNWAEARALFRRAHALLPSARTFRGMGMAAFELKMYVEALRELSAALQDTQRPLTEEQRAQVKSLIEQSRAYVGRYQVQVEPAGAKPLVDGQEAALDEGNILLLALGDHTVSASAEGYQEVSVPLRVEGGEDLVLKIQLSPLPPAGQSTPAPAPPPAAAPSEAMTPPPAKPRESGTLTTVGWVLVGGAAVFGGAAAAFWFMGEGKYDDLEKSCGTTGCSEKQISDSGVKTSDTLTTLGLGLAGAAAVGAVLCFVLDDGQGAESGTASIHIGPTAVDLRGSF